MLPSQPFPGAMPSRGINTENSVIRGSNLKGGKSPFWIILNYLQERKRWDPTNYSLYDI